MQRAGGYLNPKVRWIIYTALGLDGASVLTSWNGTTTWHETIGVVIGSVFAIATGFIAPDRPPV